MAEIPLAAMKAVAERLDGLGLDYAFLGGSVVGLLLDQRLGDEAKAARDAMDEWEVLGIDWEDFHPKARQILDSPFFWGCTDDFAPHGKAKERTSLQCPTVLGIDEHSLHRKQRFATTFCDLKNRRVFDITPGKSDADLEGFLERLQGREQVRLVCIDLSSSYRALIQRWFPRAMIVADRFHVVRVVMRHLLGIARQVYPQLAWKLGLASKKRTVV